jgi:hypothetical protein
MMALKSCKRFSNFSSRINEQRWLASGNSAGEAVERLARDELLSDLLFEFDAVVAVLGHGLLGSNWLRPI